MDFLISQLNTQPNSVKGIDMAEDKFNSNTRSPRFSTTKAFAAATNAQLSGAINLVSFAYPT